MLSPAGIWLRMRPAKGQRCATDGSQLRCARWERCGKKSHVAVVLFWLSLTAVVSASDHGRGEKLQIELSGHNKFQTKLNENAGAPRPPRTLPVESASTDEQRTLTESASAVPTATPFCVEDDNAAAQEIIGLDCQTLSAMGYRETYG